MYLVADLVTRIKNANMAEKDTVDIVFSNLNKNILDLLQKNGYIEQVKTYKEKNVKMISVLLNPGAITDIKVVSKPGRRMYANLTTLKNEKRNLGLTVLSTPKGVLSKPEAIKQSVGGEVLCKIW